MSIHIYKGKDIAQKLSEKENTDISEIQSMPCRIFEDCEAEVSKYFTNQVEAKCIEFRAEMIEGHGLDYLTSIPGYRASFRGYPLIGQKVDIPSKYTGLVIEEKLKPDTDKEDRRFYIMNKFDSFMHWNWDKVPSASDRYVQALNEWIDIAEALHEPITELD